MLVRKTPRDSKIFERHDAEVAARERENNQRGVMAADNTVQFALSRAGLNGDAYRGFNALRERAQSGADMSGVDFSNAGLVAAYEQSRQPRATAGPSAADGQALRRRPVNQGFGVTNPQVSQPVAPAPATQPTAPLDPAARRETFMDRQVPGSVYSSAFNPAPGDAEGQRALKARNDFLANLGYGSPSETETKMLANSASTPATTATAPIAPYGTHDPAKLGIARRPVSQRGTYGVLSSDRL